MAVKYIKLPESGKPRLFACSFLLPVSILLFLIAATGCRKSQNGETDSPYQEKFDLVYGVNPLQTFDLFLPEGHDQHTKVIILLHGGGWISGEKAYCGYYAKQFTGFGFAAVSMNYRLANDTVHYREMLNDIDSMIVCISKNASQWGIGSGHLALFGYSAGGHLALLYSYSRVREKKITSVVSLAGVTNIQDSVLWASPGLYDEIKRMTGDTSSVNWAQANPAHYVSATNAATLLIHGTNDSVVPVSQSIQLNDVMRVYQAPGRLLLLENETHYFSEGATEQFLIETKQFLDANMK